MAATAVLAKLKMRSASPHWIVYDRARRRPRSTVMMFAADVFQKYHGTQLFMSQSVDFQTPWKTTKRECAISDSRPLALGSNFIVKMPRITTVGVVRSTSEQ